MVRRSLALSCAAALCLWLVMMVFAPAAQAAGEEPAAVETAVEAQAASLSLPCRTAILIDQDKIGRAHV